MLFEIQFLERRVLVIDTFDLKCAEALVKQWVDDMNRSERGRVTVVAVKEVLPRSEAA